MISLELHRTRRNVNNIKAKKVTESFSVALSTMVNVRLTLTDPESTYVTLPGQQINDSAINFSASKFQ